MRAIFISLLLFASFANTTNSATMNLQEMADRMALKGFGGHLLQSCGHEGDRQAGAALHRERRGDVVSRRQDYF